jgi:hypothetical protein
MTEQRYVVENVGGVERAELTLKPGLNVLSGPNGCGKTSSMHAILRTHGADIPVSRRDGSERGSVIGPGNLRLVVGDVARRTGKAELGLVDTAPLDALIDPGFADDDASARARIRALVTLLRLGATDEHLAHLAADPALGAWLRQELTDRSEGDLFVAAEILRHEIMRRARGYEQTAEQAEGRVVAARERAARELAEIGADRLTDFPEADARNQLVLAGQEYEKQAAAARARAKLEAQQAEIRATLGERPNPDVHSERARALAQEGAQVDREIEALKIRRERLQADEDAARAAYAAATLEARRWDAAQEILARPVEGPLEADLPAIHERLVGIAGNRLEDAVHSEAHRRALAEAKEAEELRAAAEADGARMREAAAHVPTLLGEILAAAGAAGVTVIEGRLAAVDGDVVTDWARLSDGQRTRRAIEIALAVYPPNAVIPLGAATWAHLDPENRALVGRMAVEGERFILTEQPTEGELRVEHLL